MWNPHADSSFFVERNHFTIFFFIAFCFCERMGSSALPVESSSSSSSPNFLYYYDYDVFFSFRGEDTRSSFISHLHMALRLKGVNVFIDDKLKRGDQISESLLKSIERSRLSLVIFSKNYASSTWCLDELVKIIEYKKSKSQAVLPVFYKVDPSEVRKQTGGFGEALAKHEANKLLTNKIQPWKEALTFAAGLSGWDLANCKDEAELIQEIVKRVLSVLNPMQLLHVAKHPVGIDFRLRKIEELVSHIGSEGVNMVGMYGIGGIGKTTLAKALYNKIANQFEGCCFLQDVRREASKHGLVKLQETLLNDILKEDLKVVSRDRGINIIRSRLCSKKVLIVLDDVDDREQLEALVGGRDWFGRGSKIIVTTRNEHLLFSHGFDDQKHKIQELNQDHALELFSWHAFKKSHPSSNYLGLSERATNYCKGLSLALVVLGSFLRGRDQAEWNCILDEFETSLRKDIKDVLQLSFDGLEDKAKDIFLDISCLLVGEEYNCAKKMLSACHLNIDFGIMILVDLSLVTIETDRVQMHELIQQMGRSIVHNESSEPGKRSRLWLVQDIWEVFVNNSGTDAVKAIKLDLPNPTKLNVDPQAFRSMKNLRLLIIRNAQFCRKIKYLPNSLKWIEWRGFAHRSLPSCFITKNLVGLDLRHSSIKRFGKRLEGCERLKHVDLSYSTLLEQINDFSPASNLEELHLINCTNLGMIDKSVFSLYKLSVLNLDGCCNLQKLPRGYFMLSSLKELNLCYCKKLEKIPDLSAASNLKRLYLQECTNLRVIHESVGSLDKLNHLDLRQCTKLVKLPSYLRLKSLSNLLLSGCCKLESFPTIAENMKSLRELDMDFTAIKELPSSIGYLTNLSILKLNGCTNLISLPNTIYLLRNLENLLLSGCSIFGMFPHTWDPTIPTIQQVCSPSKMMETASWSLEFPHLLVPNESLCAHFTLLDLESCNISNAKFLELLCDVAPFLSDLRLSENKFSSLPSCLHKFMSLWNLELRNCKFLQEIPNLPENIQKMDASGCESLARNPDNIVDIISKKQDLTLGEISREFLLTGIEIPEWFSYKTTSNLVTASFRHYPDMERTLAACVSFKVNGDSSKRGAQISCSIFICSKLHSSFSRPFLPSKSEYMWLVTTSLAWGSMEVNDWNKVLVWFEVHEAHSEVNATITRCGVHVTEELHGIQMDVKWPMVNYADFYQLEKLQSLDIEDLLLKSFLETVSCLSNSKAAMLHAGNYDPEAIIDSNIQPMIFPLHVTNNDGTYICGGMGGTALANSLCNKFKGMEGQCGEALDNSTSFFHIKRRQLLSYSWSPAVHHRKCGDGERGTNITTHTISSKRYLILLREAKSYQDVHDWFYTHCWIKASYCSYDGRGDGVILIEGVDTSLL
ncbi:disease resistance protein RUN1-like isoform X1 [Cucumis melo]|uniref:Disease resistance protein RUN1-like isoform X1 n=2 Tax=Cucumis melo TaxID=3656 RepID=A0A1S3C088_CUCME|nr:disease resistance protein RUN1-like isoform X1 [Cucumis melo]